MNRNSFQSPLPPPAKRPRVTIVSPVEEALHEWVDDINPDARKHLVACASAIFEEFTARVSSFSEDDLAACCWIAIKHDGLQRQTPNADYMSYVCETSARSLVRHEARVLAAVDWKIRRILRSRGLA